MIHITSADDFKRLLEALAADVVTANIHWRLYRDLHHTLGEGERVAWHQSRTFWHLTLNAHTFTALQALSRAFDQNQTSLHLLSWLKTIQKNLQLFSVESFKTRLAGNPFVDSLAEHPRMPDLDQLLNDIELVSDADPKVKSLILHRGNILAHRNARTVAAGRNLGEEFGITVFDLEELLNRALLIVNRYSVLFSASTYSRQMIGHDDYKYVISSVTEAVGRSRDNAR